HRRVGGRRPHEAEATAPELLRQRRGLGRRRRKLGERARRPAATPASRTGGARIRLVPPHDGGQRLPARVHLAYGLSVGDGCLDLAAVTHDARVREKTLDVAGTEGGHRLRSDTAARPAALDVISAAGEPRGPALTDL